jgi:hypothetical protein
MNEDLQEYLRYVGIVEGVESSFITCEICDYETFSTVCDYVSIGQKKNARLPVVCCERCGFVMQNPRFNKYFYDSYYEKYYRTLLFGDSKPDRGFIKDQIYRGERLYSSLSAYTSEPGCLLDVGCSSGGLMSAFARRGWSVLGTDPDEGYVDFGCRNLGLNIECVSAEDMNIPDEKFDLIIITGSLEHVFDINRTLNICRNAAKKDSLILIEGFAFNNGITNGYFSHNHRRYLTEKSINLIMQKHGWEALWTTSDLLCGSTRPGGVYGLGKASKVMSSNTLLSLIESGQCDNFIDIKARTALLTGASK